MAGIGFYRVRVRRRALVHAAASLILLALVAISPAAVARQESAIVIDYESGEVLYANEPDTAAYPASLTKMMTLYLVFEALEGGRVRPTTKLRVSPRAAAMPPTKLGLKAGSAIRVEDAVMGLITRSANDAATVVAEALGGSEARFAAQMTRVARRLGMTSTTFRNASGLPDVDQETTARDMAVLALRLIRDYPEHYVKFSKRQFAFGGRRIVNHNRLLAVYEGADGIKTGYTRASGYNLVTSATRDGRRLIGVVLGGKSSSARDRRMVALLDRGFTRPGGGSPVAIAATPVLASQPPTPVAAPRRAAAVATREDALGGSGSLGAAVGVLAGAGDKDPALAAPSRQRVLPSVAADRPGSKTRPTQVAAAGAARPPANPYGVQVGVFRSLKEAQRSVQVAVRRAPTLLRGTFASVGQVRGAAKRTDYRAQLIGLSRESAEASCRTLREFRQTCSVVRTTAVAVAAN